MFPAVEIALLGLRVTLTGELPSAFLIRLAVLWVITSVGGKFEPPPTENVTASPGATNPTRTAIAPALATLSTFRLTAQVPRSTSATAPLGFASSVSPGQARPT